MHDTKQAFQPNREELSEFLRGQMGCTISTIDPEGVPSGAYVAFSETAEGHFIINTKQSSRKARNLLSNPGVSLTITNEEARYTVQLQGSAELLTSETFESYADRFYEKLPFLRALRDDPEQVRFLVTPTFLRFSDCSSYPWVPTEYSPTLS